MISKSPFRQQDPPSDEPNIFSKLLGLNPIIAGGKAIFDLAKNQIANNIRPVGYGDNPASRVASSIFKPELGSVSKSGNIKGKSIEERQDFLGLMLKGKQPHKSLQVSQTRPSNSTNPDAVYYNSAITEKSIKENLKNPKFLKSFKPNKKGVYSKTDYLVDNEGRGYDGNSLGNFTMNLGEDDKGKYVSYYDKWDLDPYKGKNKVLNTISNIAQDIAGVKPAEAYGRVYYNKKGTQ
jgi:hypothetical protein|tara:strand:- start:31 stop:738 length:708 start_codon:yes stop_codon:yes gene_type:complete